MRLVRMNRVDLEQFQFDYDLTWAALFLHPDGTVLARYGSHGPEGPMSANSLAGLQRTMERVLAAHSAFPANRRLFERKRGPRPRYRHAGEIPSGTVRAILEKRECVHCHNVYDGLHDALIARGEYDPRELWKYPRPEAIGCVFDTLEGNRILRVLESSAAEEAGLRAGDILEALDGQAILSLADVQFALHHAPAEAAVEVTLRREGGELSRTLRLGRGWKAGGLAELGWRGSMYHMPPSPGLWITELAPEERAKLGLPDGRLALRVRGLFKPAVRRSGLGEGDVIVGVAGDRGRKTPGELHAHLRLDYYEPGSVLRLQVLRGSEEREVEVRF